MKEVEIKGAEAGKLTVALSGDIDSGNADEFRLRRAELYRQHDVGNVRQDSQKRKDGRT